MQPAQATIAMTKSYFSDTDGNYSADGQAVIGLNSLVSGLITSTNTSPFPVGTMTITEPSATSPSEFEQARRQPLPDRLPGRRRRRGRRHHLCDDTDIRTLTFTAPPTTVDIPTPCPNGDYQSITVTFTGTDVNGEGTIAQNAVATLGIQGRLNDQVTDDDVNNGGVSNCASGTATSTGQRHRIRRRQRLRECRGPAGLRAAERDQDGASCRRSCRACRGSFDLSFKNNGTIPATGVVLADPADPTSPSNPFLTIRLG